MGVGGTYDVVAGKVNRAPAWMQKVWSRVVLSSSSRASQNVAALPNH